jgi:hypothetical protein
MVLIADLADLLGGMCPRIMPMGLIWLIDFAGTLMLFSSIPKQRRHNCSCLTCGARPGTVAET